MLDMLSRWPMLLSESLPNWLSGLSGGRLTALGAVGLGLLMLTLVAAPWLIARLPVDHFAIDRRAARKRGPLRVLVMVASNALAVLALLLGLVMLITPGPGVVMLVVALSLADFPGRHRLVQRLVSRPAVFDALNWLRRRRGRPAFQRPLPGKAATRTAQRDLPLALVLLAGVVTLTAVPPSHAQSDDADDIDAAGGTPVPQTPSAASVADELARTAERLEQLDAALAATRQQRQALAARLESDSSLAAERSARVDDLAADVERYSATLSDLEQRVHAEREALAARRARLADDLRRLQRVQGPGPLAVLLQHDDPVLADRVSVWAGYALRAQRRAIIEQAEQLARVDAARATALKDRNWVEHLKRKATGQRDVRLGQSRASREAVTTIDSRITETTRSVATLRKDSERLQGVLEELRAAEDVTSGYFAAGKGRWPMPVDGQVDARFGDAKSVGRLSWNGLFIRAEPGRPVTAIADGELVYADWLTGFGLLAIVDHGDGWMSLYGGNEALLAPVGTWVESGATIATTGSSGGQSSSGLYFELRQDARPVDPEPWLSGIG